jgi:hypothetical protein
MVRGWCSAMICNPTAVAPRRAYDRRSVIARTEARTQALGLAARPYAMPCARRLRAAALWVRAVMPKIGQKIGQHCRDHHETPVKA